MEFIDLHQDIAGAASHTALTKQTSFQQLASAHAKVVFGTGFALPHEALVTVVERDMATYESVCAQDPRWRIVKNARDLQEIHSSSDARGVVFHIEGLSDLGQDNSLLRTWHRRGLRSLGLVWNTDNPYGGGTHSSTGLTARGAALVEEAESLEILIDLAHANPLMYADVLRATKRPPFVSHGGLRSMVNSDRNYSDAQLQAVAHRGGIVGIFFPRSSMAVRDIFTTADIAEHIVAAVDILGEDAVAIGSDFGGMTSGTPSGLDSVSEIGALWDALEAQGLSNDTVQKIAYKNAYRYLSDTLPR